MSIFKRNTNSIYGKYPCKDILHNALRFIEEGNYQEAYDEILFALDKAGDSTTPHEQKIRITHRDMKKEWEQWGIDRAISHFLSAIQTWDKFGYDGTKLFRLTKENSDDYVGYIHMSDVIKCAEVVRSDLKNER